MTKDALEKIEKEFDDKFVYIDTGPDGDGYDALPPEWNKSFKLEGLEEDQIEKIKSFYHTALSTLLQQVGEEIIGEDEVGTEKRYKYINDWVKCMNDHKKQQRSRLDSVISSMK